MDNQPQHTSIASLPWALTDAMQLDELLQLHQDVLDSLPMLVTVSQVISRTEVRILLVNRKGLEASGFTRANLIGKRVEDYLPPEVAARVYARLQKCMDTGTILEM